MWGTPKDTCKGISKDKRDKNGHARCPRPEIAAQIPSRTRDETRIRICAERMRLGWSKTKSLVRTARDAAARRQKDTAMDR
jgi:hypothetical protein